MKTPYDLLVDERFGHVTVLNEGGEWVLIGAKGAGPWDRYRVRATSIVEVRA